MFVMVLDVHKWVAMPAVVARSRQSAAAAALTRAGDPGVHSSACLPCGWSRALPCLP